MAQVSDKPIKNGSSEIQIRPANPADTALILTFIRDLAEHGNMLHQVKATPELINESLFSENKCTNCLIAELDGKPAGFAFFFFNFSTFMGRQGLYLEDLFVKQEFRSQGIGFKLLQAMAKIAASKGCPRMEWSVLNWNQKAISFYERLGAKQMNEWSIFRLETDDIQKLAEAQPIPAPLPEIDMM